MQQPAAEPTLDLRDYLGVLRRRKWSIALIAVVTVASALAFSFWQTPIYASTAKVLVKPPTTNQYLQNVPAATLVSLDTERELVQSEAVARIAKKTLSSNSSIKDLLDQVSVSVPTNTQILEITFSDPNPAAAQAGSQAFAQAYLEFKTTQALEAFTSVRTGIQKQIDSLEAKLADARAELAKSPPGSAEAQLAQTEIDTATSQLAIYRNQIGTLSVVDVNPGDIIEPADLPTSPASPNFILNGGLAVFVGLALGIGLSFLRERLDDRLGGRPDFEGALGAPVLAVVPKVEGWRKRERTELPALKASKGAPAEAYRTIRTNLLFMAKDGDLKVIAVTSPGDGEGKTTTVANLAVSLAQADKRVVAVSCDLRKPRLHGFYDASNGVGVTSVLENQTTLPEAVQRAGVDTLRVLASGPIPHNPSELLASGELDALLARLRGVADFVIVDTPPVLAVSDALILAPKCDGVIIVADASTTTRGAVVHVREQLDQVGGNIIGGVFNNFDPSRAKDYASYYRYYYSYRYQPEDETPRPARASDSVRGRSPGEETTVRVEEGETGTNRSAENIWRTDDVWR